MFRKSIVAAVAALAVGVALAQPAAAGVFTGQTLRIEYLFGGLESVFRGPADITEGGAEVVFNIGSNLGFTLSGDTLSTSEDCEAPCQFNSGYYNGFHLFDAYGTVADFTSVAVTRNDYPGFDASRITFDANNIYVNLQGLQFAVTPSEFNLQVNATSAPEPAAWALMIGGFGLAGGMLRRRRATTTAA